MAKATPLTIEIPAVELRTGDFIPNEGVVTHSWIRANVLYRTSNGGARLVPRDERLVVHLEDTGKEKPKPCKR